METAEAANEATCAMLQSPTKGRENDVRDRLDRRTKFRSDESTDLALVAMDQDGAEDRETRRNTLSG